MTANARQDSNALAAIIFAVFAVACVVAFLAFRGSDVGQLAKLSGNLGGPLFGYSGFQESVSALTIALVISTAWFGLGGLIGRFIGFGNGVSPLVKSLLFYTVGAAAWSLIWFLLGLVGLYSAPFAIAAAVAGVGLAPLSLKLFRGVRSETIASERITFVDRGIQIVLAIDVLLAAISALAPPTAKDTLLYHFALPKAFLAQHSNAFIEGNIASYLALGTEMHSVWAMLLGNMDSLRAGEAAAGATTFLFLPLLLLFVYGYSRETGISRTWSLLLTTIVATVPTAYYVASSDYIDLSLALYVTLATYGLTRWWNEQTWSWAILIAIFLGAALSVKLTAVFVIAAFALVISLRARDRNAPVASVPGSDKRDNKAGAARHIIATGSVALLLAGLIASPWYIRTWVATGSPVFPFYMNIWPGNVNGWDVERSDLFQAMNSTYGGADVTKLNYLTAPVRVSVAAQPEQPENYDGVLGPAFLIGLPLLIYALWRLDLAVEVKIMVGMAGVAYLFWLFSSEQLRYLLPIVPMMAIAIAAAAEKIGGRVTKVAQCSLVAATVCGLLTIAAWFCQTAPLRVVLGGETRDQYLAHNLDYYPYYQSINTETAADARIWLINMRRDTYNIDRPVVSDYLFEDWTLRNMLWQSRSVDELRAKAATLNVQYVLARHDFLFDYDRSALVDDKKPRAENAAMLKIAKDFLLDPQRVVRADGKFSLVRVF